MLASVQRAGTSSLSMVGMPRASKKETRSGRSPAERPASCTTVTPARARAMASAVWASTASATHWIGEGRAPVSV